MNNVLTVIPVALAVALASGAVSPDIAGAVDHDREFAARINDANAALRNDDFDAAIAGYDSAAEIDSNRDEVLYNKAVALYRKGDVVGAEKLFATVATSLDRGMAAKARFNSGNCHYASAVDSRDEDRQAAMENLRAAIEEYRSALAIEPNDVDARANIELAARLLKQLQQEEQQEQERQQQQDQQRQDQQDQQQQQEAQQSQSSDQQNQQGGEGEPQHSENDAADQENAEQQQPEQQQSEQQSTAQSGETSDSDSDRDQNDADAEPGESPQPDDASEDQPPAGAENQASTRTTPKRDEMTESSSDEPEAAEEESGDEAEETPRGQLTTANESEESPSADRSVVVGGSDRDGELTEQEAYKMLQAIRDRDMLRRLRREAAERSRRTPVDRDW